MDSSESVQPFFLRKREEKYFPFSKKKKAFSFTSTRPTNKIVRFSSEFSLKTLTKYSSHSPKKGGESTTSGEEIGGTDGEERGEAREGKREENALDGFILTLEQSQGKLKKKE